MKPLLFASLLVLSSASVALAQCRNVWCRAACNNNGECTYVKVLSRNYPYVIFLDNRSNGLFKVQADCQQYKQKTLEVDGVKIDFKWEQAMPGSIGEAVVETACKM